MKFANSLAWATLGFATLLLSPYELRAQDYAFPPSVLYHFGEQKFLLEDARADNIPQEAWDNFIMGSASGAASRFDLARDAYRRGLYGSTHPAYADYYGDTLLRTGKQIGFMAIHIKPACLAPDRIFGKDAQDPERFARWGKKKGLSLDEAKNRPLEFLDEERIQVLLDFEWKESWIIRDRNCIARIDGEADELLQIYANDRGLWKKMPLGTEHPIRSSWALPTGLGLFTILVRSLHDAKPVSVQLLEKIRLNAKDSDLEGESGKPPLDKAWIVEALDRLVTSLKACTRPEQIENFRLAAQKFLEIASFPEPTLTREEQQKLGRGWESWSRGHPWLPEALETLLKETQKACTDSPLATNFSDLETALGALSGASCPL